MKAAVPDLFVNARTDTWWLGWTTHCRRPSPAPVPTWAAGADGIFVPGIVDLATLRVLTEADRRSGERAVPAGRPRAWTSWAAAGVARVSTGSLLFRAALAAALAAADAVRPGGLATRRGCRRTPRCRPWCRRAATDGRGRRSAARPWCQAGLGPSARAGGGGCDVHAPLGGK